MPILPQWTDEHKTAIVINYQGHWTWEEFQRAVDAVNTLMRSVNYSVILIHNTLESANLPPGNILAQGRTAISGFADNLMLIIVVANSTLIRTFVNIAAGLNPGGRGNIIKTVASLEQAQRIVETILANPTG
jgi:hypothetical protein